MGTIERVKALKAKQAAEIVVTDVTVLPSVEPPKQPKAKKPPRQLERLPDQSAFSVTYSANSKSWSGDLTVPGCQEPFSSVMGGVFPLLSRLDALYRAWVIRNEPSKTDGV